MFPINMFTFGTNQPFKSTYECFPVAMMAGHERDDVEKGGKIIMPASALQQLTNANISYPMLFKLTNSRLSRITHCGVLEFVADEGRVYLPLWMMENLMLNDGDPVEVENILLPVATFSRFQPQSTDFLDISNPKAVLENCLRHFACLTTGDVINLKYNDKDYQLSVLETQPSDAVLIIECDMNVEFAAPIGYVEPEQEPKTKNRIEPETQNAGFVAFSGAGNRLDGKSKKRRQNEGAPVAPGGVRGVPDFEWRPGTITFFRNVFQEQSQPCSSSTSKVHRFPGLGDTLCTK